MNAEMIASAAMETSNLYAAHGTAESQLIADAFKQFAASIMDQNRHSEPLYDAPEPK